MQTACLKKGPALGSKVTAYTGANMAEACTSSKGRCKATPTKVIEAVVAFAASSTG
jgi:hypothetical protein